MAATVMNSYSLPAFDNAFLNKGSFKAEMDDIYSSVEIPYWQDVPVELGPLLRHSMEGFDDTSYSNPNPVNSDTTTEYHNLTPTFGRNMEDFSQGDLDKWFNDYPNRRTHVVDDDELSVMLDYNDLAFLDDFVGTSDSDVSSASNDGLALIYRQPKTESGTTHLPSFKDIYGRKRNSDSGCDESFSSSSSMTSSDTEDEDYIKPYCKSRRGAKNVLLWKFLLQTLDLRPDLIKWVNRREGIFKFVDTSALSRMWGEKKRKRDMNFEKLSRGIRHYYKTGLMQRIEGTRLVYKFNWSSVPKPFRKAQV